MILLLIIVSIVSCRYRTGSGNIVTEKRNTGSFNGIIVGGGFDVELRNGATEVTVEADDNIIKYIETTVENGQLKIRFGDNFSLHDAHMKIYISSPEINSIKASASANVDAKDILKSGKSIRFQSSSGSEIQAAVDAPEITVDASSGGEIKLRGRTKDVTVEGSSGADIKAKELLAESSRVTASSGATVSVYASVSLDVTASSGANVHYQGGANVKQSVSSGGEVDKD